MIISRDYLNFSLANEYVDEVTIPTQVIRYKKKFSRRISQSDCSIQIKLHYYTITCLIIFQRDGKKGYDHEFRPNNLILMRLSGPYSYC
jgi:hypothetical protein